MSDHIDEFESIFKRAERERFVYAEVPVHSVALITDGSPADAAQARDQLVRFHERLQGVESWRSITSDQFANVGQLLERLNESQTDLIVTWRHLQERSLIPQHSLGVYLDVLTQTTSIPVLVLPGTAASPLPLQRQACDRVMVVADHISGDNRLINYGVRMCRNGGTIWLCHVEDDRVFQRYMHAIERIPRIDTGDARSLIREQLTKEASDFISDCIAELHDKGPNINYESSVAMGHFLREYRELIERHDIDLLVANTKDDDQLAMHGVAYSLSVEMTGVSMLLL